MRQNGCVAFGRVEEVEAWIPAVCFACRIAFAASNHVYDALRDLCGAP